MADKINQINFNEQNLNPLNLPTADELINFFASMGVTLPKEAIEEVEKQYQEGYRAAYKLDSLMAQAAQDSVQFSSGIKEVTIQPWGTGTDDCVWNALKGAGWTDEEIRANGLVQEVARMNNLDDPNVVKAGQKLIVPVKGEGYGVNGSYAASPEQGPGANYQGNVAYPLRNYHVTQEYGMTDFARSGAYGGKQHSGIDLGARQGEPVYAVMDGEITQVGYDPGGYGNWVEIRHPDGTTTRYGHLSAFGNISKGQHVSAGYQIGNVGSTGYSTGPHLHFEYRVNGRPVDPRRLLNF